MLFCCSCCCNKLSDCEFSICYEIFRDFFTSFKYQHMRKLYSKFVFFAIALARPGTLLPIVKEITRPFLL